MPYGSGLLLSVCITFLLLLPACASDSDYASLTKQLPKAVSTTHFTVHSTGGPDAQWAASFLECLWTFVDHNFCPIKKTFHRDVFLFPRKEDFMLREKTAKMDKPSDFGYYDPQARAFFTYPDSGYGTYAHEFIHAVVYDCDLQLEPWAQEGIPAIFEKIYGYCNYANPVFFLGYPNPWRVKALNRSLTTIDLQAVVLNTSSAGISCEEQREVGLFLLKEGRLRRYLELARTGRKDGFPTLFESAMQASLSDIVPKWRYHLEGLQRKADKIQEIPGSAYFSTKKEFDNFLSTDGLILQQFR
jgi:hypothetical protein